MKSKLYAGAAALALCAGAAAAQDLKFAPGEDARFNWASYDAFKQDLGRFCFFRDVAPSAKNVSGAMRWFVPFKDRDRD